MKTVSIASRARRLRAAVLVTVTVGVIWALPAHATIIKSPPWADEFAAKYPDAAGNGLDTDAAPSGLTIGSTPSATSQPGHRTAPRPRR